MKILYVADGQNPHAHVWFNYALQQGHEVHVASTYPIEAEELGVASVFFVPFDFSAKVRAEEKKTSYQGAPKRGRLSKLRGSPLWFWLARVRNRLAPYYAERQAPRLRKIIQELQPDLVHGLRVPFEGICAALAVESLPVPLILSTWGNDFTLFAESDPKVMALTRRALARADGLQSDCAKDITIARELGFAQEKTAIQVPGSLGLDLARFTPDSGDRGFLTKFGIPAEARLVVNPRGPRAYVRNEAFFGAIPEILAAVPNVWFAAVAMQGVEPMELALQKLGPGGRTTLLPAMNRDEMAKVLGCAEVVISMGEHDGTPNSLLESMAAGAYPIAIDIPSLREVVTNGVSGTLISKADSHELATATIEALRNASLRAAAKEANQDQMARFGRSQVIGHIDRMYAETVARRPLL